MPGTVLERYVTEVPLNAVGLDWMIDKTFARERIQTIKPVQGNLDPLVLIAGGEALDRAVDDVMRAFSDGPFIFNLGHGITPETPIENVERMLRRVRGVIGIERCDVSAMLTAGRLDGVGTAIDARLMRRACDDARSRPATEASCLRGSRPAASHAAQHRSSNAGRPRPEPAAAACASEAWEDNREMLYLWLKALHIIAVIAWMAGMLYLPRLFVYHCEAEPGSTAVRDLQGDGAPAAARRSCSGDDRDLDFRAVAGLGGRIFQNRAGCMPSWRW